MRRAHQLHVPADLIFSCRADDVLMLPEITRLRQEANDEETSNSKGVKGLRSCTLLLTSKTPNESPPFPDIVMDEEEQLKQLPSNLVVQRDHLSPDLVQLAESKMPPPCRIVVSGPSGFNAAVRSLLLEAHGQDDAITILEA